MKHASKEAFASISAFLISFFITYPCIIYLIIIGWDYYHGFEIASDDIVGPILLALLCSILAILYLFQWVRNK